MSKKSEIYFPVSLGPEEEVGDKVLKGQEDYQSFLEKFALEDTPENFKQFILLFLANLDEAIVDLYENL